MPKTGFWGSSYLSMQGCSSNRCGFPQGITIEENEILDFDDAFAMCDVFRLLLIEISRYKVVLDALVTYE